MEACVGAISVPKNALPPLRVGDRVERDLGNGAFSSNENAPAANPTLFNIEHN
jgi:hypothetical protein